MSPEERKAWDRARKAAQEAMDARERGESPEDVDAKERERVRNTPVFEQMKESDGE